MTSRTCRSTRRTTRSSSAERSFPGELERIRKELDDLSAKWYLKLTAVRDVLVDKLDELQAIPKFGRTEYAFMIVGWVPTEDCKTVEGKIQERFGSEVIVTRCEISEKDFGDAPVALKNAEGCRPLPVTARHHGQPELRDDGPDLPARDLLSAVLRHDRRRHRVRRHHARHRRLAAHEVQGQRRIQIATAILGPACTMAVAFGFVYAEFFGNLFSKYIPLFPLIEPSTAVPTLENNPLIPPLQTLQDRSSGRSADQLDDDRSWSSPSRSASSRSRSA